MLQVVKLAYSILALSLCALPAFADNLAGQASTIDGDTLEIHGSRVRLWGIDAPESSQLCRDDDSDLYRCGAKAADELDAFIAQRPVSCEPVGLDVLMSMVVQSQRAQLVASTWEIGWCGAGWHSIGRSIQMADTARIRTRLRRLSGACGRGVTSRRGCIGTASRRAGSRVLVRTMRV
jgi:hypothetical protein